MARLLGHLPSTVTVALSGGSDSVGVLSFLLRSRNRSVNAAFFHHGTQTSDDALKFVKDLCTRLNVDLEVGFTKRERDKSESAEEYWRNERYSFLHSLGGDVITAHNLEDCVETWVWSAMHGNPHVINYRNANVIRPFLLFPKDKLRLFCSQSSNGWIEDASNLDISYSRNYIRNVMIPHVLHINPGIHKVVRRKILEAFNEPMLP